MCVKSSASIFFIFNPRACSPPSNVSTVDSGPGSMIALVSLDSINSAAIDRGLPIQFRSMVVKVAMLTAVYQFLLTLEAGLRSPPDGKDLLAKSHWIDIGCLHRTLSFFNLPACERSRPAREAPAGVGADKTKIRAAWRLSLRSPFYRETRQ